MVFFRRNSEEKSPRGPAAGYLIGSSWRGLRTFVTFKLGQPGGREGVVGATVTGELASVRRGEGVSKQEKGVVVFAVIDLHT